MDKKFEEIIKELEEINKQLAECTTRMAYLRGILIGMKGED